MQEHRPAEALGYTDVRAALWLVLTVTLVWLGLAAADWYYRFSWFQWQRTFIAGLSQRWAGPYPPLITNDVAATVGGDLTRLIGIPEATRGYELEHPAYQLITDELGFRNQPPAKDKDFPIVVVGDSYMNAGGPTTNLFSAQLERIAHLDVYNFCHPGRGPFYALTGFLGSERFRQRAPRLLVWGLVEREIAGEFMAGMLYQVYTMKKGRANPEENILRSHMWWQGFSPRHLKGSLPNSSLIAQFSARIWNRVRYQVFGRFTPDVIVTKKKLAGHPVLFYGESVEAMKWSAKTRDVKKVVWAIKHLQTAICDPQGVELLVVLIPDKAQVYRDLLPAHLNSPQHPLPSSCLWALEEGMKREGVRVVNLLPAYREAVTTQSMLYWPDDTHWTPEGIRMAAELTWDAARDLFPAGPVGPSGEVKHEEN